MHPWPSLPHPATGKKDPEEIDTTADSLKTMLKAREGIEVLSWRDLDPILVSALEVERAVMFFILFMIVLVAAFNIIAGQTMLVADKRQNIAILRTMGATQELIRNVFFLQGAVVSVSGTLLGLLLGTYLCLYVNEIMAGVESITGMHLLDGSFFVEIPVLVEGTDLLVISAMALSICLMAAYLPAKKAAAMDPILNLH